MEKTQEQTEKEVKEAQELEQKEMLKLHTQRTIFFNEINLLSMLTGFEHRGRLVFTDGRLVSTFDIDERTSKDEEDAIQEYRTICYDRAKQGYIDMGQTPEEAEENAPTKVDAILEEIAPEITKQNPVKANKQRYELGYRKLCEKYNLVLVPIISGNEQMLYGSIDVTVLNRPEQPKPEPEEEKSTEPAPEESDTNQE